MFKTVAARRMAASGVKKAITLGVKQRQSELAFGRFMEQLAHEVVTDHSSNVPNQTSSHARLIEPCGSERQGNSLTVINQRAVSDVGPVDDATEVLTPDLSTRPSLDSRTVFGRQAVPAFKPFGDVRLALTDGASERGLRANDADGSSKRFAIGVRRIHGEDHK